MIDIYIFKRNSVFEVNYIFVHTNIFKIVSNIL